MDKGVIMRAGTKAHARSERAAWAALTAMERGRLNHIARSIRAKNATVSRHRRPQPRQV